MEYSIQEVAKAAGTTSRTLRHYGAIGLVVPSRVGHNGYRYYDERSLVRLQRVLLLRELGLGLDAIARVLEAQDAERRPSESAAAAETGILRKHLALLQRERDRIDAQIGAVDRTIAALAFSANGNGKEGKDWMTEHIFDGFDHAQYREEVEQRWGADAYTKSDSWWRGMSEEQQRAWQQRVGQLSDDWAAEAERGEDPAAPAAQELARRHVEWLRSVPHTPASTPGGDLSGYVLGLAEMYVADERFAANYGGTAGAEFVRDALRLYVEREPAQRSSPRRCSPC